MQKRKPAAKPAKSKKPATISRPVPSSVSSGDLASTMRKAYLRKLGEPTPSPKAAKR